MDTLKEPIIFREQQRFIKNYFRSEVDKKYNNMFNASSRRIIIAEKNKTCMQVLKNYPSLFRQYNSEFNEYIILYKKHRIYFHQNIFEELMQIVWHPDNFHKFEHWDPEIID